MGLDAREFLSNKQAEETDSYTHQLQVSRDFMAMLHGGDCFCPSCGFIRTELARVTQETKAKQVRIQRESVGPWDEWDVLLALWIAEAMMEEEKKIGGTAHDPTGAQ